MNKKTLLGLILFSCVIISGMFLTTEILIEQSSNSALINTKNTKINQTEDNLSNYDSEEYVKKDTDHGITSFGEEQKEEILEAVPTKQASNQTVQKDQNQKELTKSPPAPTQAPAKAETKDPKSNHQSFYGSSITASSDTVFKPQLIIDHNKVNYKAHIPEMEWDNELKSVLNIKNPKLQIEAEAAILFDAKTKKVLYYKNPVKAVFPASTVKLLTAILALNYCDIKEEVTIGDEIQMITSDSTRAYLNIGDIMTIENLLEGLLLPSGNDAAYAIAAFVGRKSLKDQTATKEEAISEFRKLMNEEAKKLGVKNSCFMTPDGYDAIGQYTTAYDMGVIAMAAVNYDKITEISSKSKISTKFVSGREVTWSNTNRLINRNYKEFLSSAIGLKTGTSSMAGRCLISAAKKDGKEVISVILNSDAKGRWEDSLQLLKFGLQ